MKKVITLLLAAVLLVTLCACGNKPQLQEEPVEVSPTPELSPTPAPSVKPSPTPSPAPTPAPSPSPTEPPEEDDYEEEAEEEDYRAEEEIPTSEETDTYSLEETYDPAEESCVTPDWDYYIKVNCTCNTVTIYTYDDNGEYTVPYMAMICSTGPATPQSGFYSFYGQNQWYWLDLFGDVSGQYVSQITGNILFHSVPYLTNGDRGSLEYWEFDKLGTASSMGCVRLQVIDAMWIFYNFENIKGVEFYNSSDPGPLGKPSAPLISWNEDCRNWDPTDPDADNPWRTWVEPTPVPTPEPTPAPTPEATVVPTAEPSPSAQP